MNDVKETVSSRHRGADIHMKPQSVTAYRKLTEIQARQKPSIEKEE